MSELDQDLNPFCSRLFAASNLHARMTELKWPGGTKEIVRLQGELDALGDPTRSHDRIEMSGLYLGMEEFASIWAIGAVDREEFALAAVDFIAREAAQDARECLNWLSMISLYGSGVVPLMEKVLSATLATIDVHYRRKELHGWPQDDQGDELIAEGETQPPVRAAPIDDESDEFCEAGISLCAPNDEHACMITYADVDLDALEELKGFLEARSKASDRVLRGLAAEPAVQ